MSFNCTSCVSPKVCNEARTACVDPPAAFTCAQCVSPKVCNVAGTACIDPKLVYIRGHAACPKEEGVSLIKKVLLEKTDQTACSSMQGTMISDPAKPDDKTAKVCEVHACVRPDLECRPGLYLTPSSDTVAPASAATSVRGYTETECASANGTFDAATGTCTLAQTCQTSFDCAGCGKGEVCNAAKTACVPNVTEAVGISVGVTVGIVVVIVGVFLLFRQGGGGEREKRTVSLGTLLGMQVSVPGSE